MGLWFKFVLLHVDTIVLTPFVENTVLSPIELSWPLCGKSVDHKH